MQSLSSIVYETIASSNSKYTFGKGRYGEFELIIICGGQYDGYSNASIICFKGGKRLPDWKVNKTATALMEAVSASTRIPKSDLMVLIDDVNNELRGTYVHPKLIPHIASWVSPKFGVMVSDIVNNYLIREYERTIKDKDDTIAELTKKVNELLVVTKETHTNLIEAKDDLAILGEQFIEQKELAIEMNMKLDSVLPERVVPLNDATKQSCFVLIKTSVYNKYYVMRAQAKYIRKKLLREGYKEEDVVLRLDALPNASHLFNRVKELLRGIRINLNYITLVSLSEDELIHQIREINNEKFIVKQPSREEQLNNMTCYDLRLICKHLNIIGVSKYTKPKLIQAILVREQANQ